VRARPPRALTSHAERSLSAGSADRSVRTSRLRAFGSARLGVVIAQQPGEHAAPALAAPASSKFSRQSREVLNFGFSAKWKTLVRQAAEITDTREVRGCCHTATLGTAGLRIGALPYFDSG